ncbi:hypothetical protein AMTRI_Chr03g49240 [Amborella trichopoda]
MVTWFGTVSMMWMWSRDWCNSSYLTPSRYTWHGMQSSFTQLLALMANLSLSLYLSMFVFCLCFDGSFVCTLVMCINAYWLLMGDLSLSLYISLCLSISLCYFFLF